MENKTLKEYYLMLESESLVEEILPHKAYFDITETGSGKSELSDVKDSDKNIVSNQNGSDRKGASKASSIVITDVSYNSKEVRDGTLFIAKGANFKTEYLEDAISKGAVAYLSDKKYDVSVPGIIVNNLRLAISRVSAFCFDKSWDEGLKIIGLTGTKGKSTTSFMIKSILEKKLGHDIGFSSGIFTFDGETKEKSRKLTTPETIELHRILDNCVKNNTEYLTMEVSSQGLKYDRVADLSYEAACFLNISEDHISPAEHSDMEDYFSSKLRIFDRAKIAVVNLDTDKNYLPRVLEAAKKCEKVITYSYKEQADITGIDCSEDRGVLRLVVSIGDSVEELYVNIGGDYNKYNALCAIAVTTALGCDIDDIRAGLEGVVVPGRMEHYLLPNDVDVIVDCAHNKISYEALFRYAQEQYAGKQIGFLFGCVGDKAFNRRKEAAGICDMYADYAVITERDPGKEPVDKICKEIFDNLEDQDKALIITDRDDAVAHILDMSIMMGNAVVLLCGCGSDAYVKRGTQLVPFMTDGERVQKYIEEL